MAPFKVVKKKTLKVSSQPFTSTPKSMLSDSPHFNSDFDTSKQSPNDHREPLSENITPVKEPKKRTDFSDTPESDQSFNFSVNSISSIDIHPHSAYDIPLSITPSATLKELEQKIVVKNPPGQWFRRSGTQKTDITCLPVELHVEILKGVTFLDQLSCERVCTTWRTIIRRDCAGFRYTRVDDSIWTGIKKPVSTPAPAVNNGPAPAVKIESLEEESEILIHRLLQDGNFAFRQIPGTGLVEMMSTFHPSFPLHPPRRFKIENMTFLNDPIAIYTSTNFEELAPIVDVEFDCQPLRNEFVLRIGGRFSTASTAEYIPPFLPRPTLPASTQTPGLPLPQLQPQTQVANPAGFFSTMIPRGRLRKFGTNSARQAMRDGRHFNGHWSLGKFLLAILGKIESPIQWHEEGLMERNERWNGRDHARRWVTGVDYDGDWDMDGGFQEQLTIEQIVEREPLLMKKFSIDGYWFMREWGKDEYEDEMHVALTPVSEWVWEISY